MEEFLIYLRQSVSRPPLNAHPGVVVMDVFWGQFMLKDHKELTVGDEPYCPSDVLLQFCEGQLPQLYGKRWTPAGRIFVPWNVGDKHWVALEIILSEWTVYVYDPDVNLYTIPRLKKALLPILQVLPRVLLRCKHLAPYTLG